MRIHNRFENRDSNLDVQMTPMIDVVFQLLIFFVWTASFQIVERLLPGSLLPAAGTETARPIEPEQLDFERIVIHVGRENDQIYWTVNDAPVERFGAIEQMLTGLARVPRVRARVPLVIDPDGGVPLGAVIEVFDLTRRLGFDKIQFAASENP